MTTYNLVDYAEMLRNDERITAYHDAIRAAIKPGAVVLEIGAGTGFMALLACKFGARRVYALEPADAIIVARQAAKDNGYADRIVFHRERSTELTLPERCDVLISDLRGANAFYGTHLTDLIDARERLLTPDATWICQRDTLFAAVVEAPGGRSEIDAQWDGARWGLDLGSALRYAVHSPSRQRFKAEQLLTPSVSWGRIDFPRLVSPHLRGEAALTVARAGPAQGLALWFEVRLHGGFGFSNPPGNATSVYGSHFLPWPKTVPLLAGDRVELRIEVVLSGQTNEWNWATTIRRKDQAEPVAAFKQSTFQGHLLDADGLRRGTAHYRPTVTAAAEEERFLLERIDGQRAQGELAAALRARFPERFADDAAAFARVLRTVRSVGA
jgi:type I protein arginine methyltransferase